LASYSGYQFKGGESQGTYPVKTGVIKLELIQIYQTNMGSHKQVVETSVKAISK